MNPLPEDRSLRGLGLGARLRILLGDSVLYGSAAALNKSLALVTFPLLARYFSVAEFGAIDFVMVAVNMLALLIVFGQDSAVARFMHDTETPEARAAVVSQAFAFQLGVIVVVTPMLIWVVPTLVRDLHSAGTARELTTLMILQLPFVVIMSFCQSLLRWTFQRGKYVFLTLGSSLSFALGLVILMRHPGQAPLAVFQLYLAIVITFAFLGCFFVRKWLTIPRAFPLLAPMLRFAVPIGLNCVLLALVPLYERMLVNAVVSASDLGLYAAGAKIAGLMALATIAFHSGWGPFSLSLHADPDAPRTFNTIFKLYACAACLAVLGLTAVGPALLVLLASQKYAGASAIIFPLAMGLAFQGLGWVVETGTTISKRTHFALLANFALIVTTAVACWILGNAIGFVGVAVGVCCGYAAFAITTFALSRHAWTLPWNYAPALGVVVITVATGVGQLLVGQQFGMAASAGVCVLGIATLTGFAYLRLFDPSERRRLWGSILRHDR